MKKKLMAIVLVIALALSLTFAFTACDPDGTDPDGGVALGAYVLTDKGTYLAYKKSSGGDRIPNLTLLIEQSDDLLNTYALIAVDPNAPWAGTTPTINTIGADAFIRWMLMPDTAELIAEYGFDDYDEALFYNLAGAQTYDGTLASLAYAGSGATTNAIRVSTTTSVNDTGLLGALEDVFENQTGWDLQVASAGTGAAINAAKAGNADLLLVHDVTQEASFISSGYGREVIGLTGAVLDSTNTGRIPFMYNFFILVGSNDDPAGVTGKTIDAAFEAIAAGSYNFISRGDGSGTHSKESQLWAMTDVSLMTIVVASKNYNAPKTGTEMSYWYISSGQGMGACLLLATHFAAVG